MADHSWIVVAIGNNQQDVQDAESEAERLADTVRKYGICLNPICCIGSSKEAVCEGLGSAARRMREAPSCRRNAFSVRLGCAV